MNDSILIVDDSFFMRSLLGNAIKDIGYSKISYAEDGIKAIEISKDIKPDLITLDISMPGMDGIETVLGILEVSPKSKIVMISAVNANDIVKQALKNGAVDFLKKPVDRSELEDMLKRHLG